MARKRRKSRRKNGFGEVAYLVNPRRKRKKSRRKSKKHTKWGMISSHKRRVNPSKRVRRKNRRRGGIMKKHKSRRRHRRNPAISSIKGIFGKLKSPGVIGGAIAGLEDLMIADRIVRMDSLRLSPAWRGPAKIAQGLVFAALMDKVGALSKYSGGYLSGKMAIAVKQIAARAMNAPQAQLEDLSDSFAALIDGPEMAALTTESADQFAELGLMDYTEAPAGYSDGQTTAYDD